MIVKLDRVPANEEDDYKAFQKKVIDDRDDYVNVVSASAAPQTTLKAGPNLQFNFLKDLPDSDSEEAMADENEARLNGMQNPTEAIAPLERAVSTDPKFARAWALLGTLYYITGRSEDSLSAIAKRLLQPRKNRRSTSS